MILPTKLAEQSQYHPEKEALIYHSQRISYKQLNTMINKLANGLRQSGILPGDRVLLVMENCPEFIISYYAIINIRGIVVPVNPHFTMNEYSIIMLDALPTAVITSKPLVLLFQKLASEIEFTYSIIATGFKNPENGIHSFENLIKQGAETFQQDKIPSRHDVIELMYTSGTSGTPKGAMLTHHNLYRNALTFAQCCKVTAEDRSLLVAPAHHATAQTCVMNTSLLMGATLVVHDGWKGPEALMEAIQNEKITFYFGPPTMYSLLVKQDDIEQYDLSSWRLAFTGAAPTPPDVLKDFEKKFGLQLIESYGLTETSPVTTVMPLDGLYKAGSIGLPIPGVEVRVVDYEDREVAIKQIGEIIIRGHNVMKGYYNRPDETEWVMRNGWFHTGDLGHKDSDGYLYIVDRKKDLIIKGDLHIHPREIEEVLYSHEMVYDAAVIGVPDPIMGEEILAFVLLREDSQITPEEVQDFCANKLAKYKIPKYIRFVENLPKTTSGKLLRGELRKMI